jgi:hypothetical protein
MTFMAGVLPNRETRPLTEQINNIRANLQLLFMNNLTAHGQSGMSMSDGFVDTFQDAIGADLSLSVARYSESGRYFSEVPGQTGLTKLIEFNGAANLEMSDTNNFSVTDAGISLKRTLIPSGATNGGTGYATLPMVSNSSPVPFVVCASSEYVLPNCPAWRAFDQNESHTTDPEQCWIATSAATEESPQWIKIDLGENMALVINKYRILSRNASDSSYVASPRNFKLFGSNNDQTWYEIDSRLDLPELGPNTWSDYLTFENSTAYRLYQLRITDSWGEGLTSLSQLKLVEAQYTVPNSVQVACVTSVPTSNWKTVTNILPNGATPGSSNIFYALCVNPGSGFEVWKIRDGSVWKDIVRVESTSWMYRDNGEIWNTSVSNNRIEALRMALACPDNQMDKQQLRDATSRFPDVFVPGTLSVAVGLQAGLDLEIPLLETLSFTYDELGEGMDLISRAFNLSEAITGVHGSMLVKNFNADLKFYFSVGDDPLEWIKFPEPVISASTKEKLELLAASMSDLNNLQGDIRVRVASAAGSPTEVHGWAMNWDRSE